MERVKISSGGNCDFISRLPDPILHQILGLLKIEEVVQTCVLSKRWEHVWTSLSSLNFHCDYDDNEAYGDEWFVTMEAFYGRFAKFVNSLLMRRQSLDLDVFRLFCLQLWSGYEREWVRYAVNHNPRVLHLTLARSIPWCVYTCSSLEELYLSDPHMYSSDLRVNLPKLRKLTIYWSDLNSIYVKNLLSGCPILEFLRLDSCIVHDCVIAHECLKHLAIENCHIIHEEHHLFINAPCLLSFLYEGNLSLPYKTTLNMPSLTSSCLTSFYGSADISLEGMATFLHFLTNIELLKLHFKCPLDMELSSADLPLELPIFPKLKNVTVAFCMFSCFQMVTWILKSSPNLTKLTILHREECLFHCEEDEDEDEASTPSTIVVSPCEKFVIVEVIYRRYNKMVRQVVDSLMDGRKEFKNLKIHCRSTRVVNNIF